MTLIARGRNREGKLLKLHFLSAPFFFSRAVWKREGKGRGLLHSKQTASISRRGGLASASIRHMVFFFLRKGTYFSCTEIEKHLFDSWHGFERYGILTLYEEEEEEETKTGLSTFGSAYHASFPRLRDSIMAPESFFADIFFSLISIPSPPTGNATPLPPPPLRPFSFL